MLNQQAPNSGIQSYHNMYLGIYNSKYCRNYPKYPEKKYLWKKRRHAHVYNINLEMDTTVRPMKNTISFIGSYV